MTALDLEFWKRKDEIQPNNNLIISKKPFLSNTPFFEHDGCTPNAVRVSSQRQKGDFQVSNRKRKCQPFKIYWYSFYNYLEGVVHCRVVGVVGTSRSVSFSVAYLKMAGATWPKRKADCWRDEKKVLAMNTQQELTLKLNLLRLFCFLRYTKVARNEVKNASFAQLCTSWRQKYGERNWSNRPQSAGDARVLGQGRTFKLAYPDPQILPQCNISSNYPL